MGINGTLIFERVEHHYAAWIDPFSKPLSGLCFRFRNPDMRGGIPIVAHYSRIEGQMYRGGPGVFELFETQPKLLDKVIIQFCEFCDGIADYIPPVKNEEEEEGAEPENDLDFSDGRGDAPPGTGEFEDVSLTPEDVTDWSPTDIYQAWKQFALLSQLSKKAVRPFVPLSNSQATRRGSSTVPAVATKHEEPEIAVYP